MERLPAATRRLANIATKEGDGEDEILRKASLILTAALVIALATVWVVTYSAFGLYLSASIPFAYQVTTVLSLVRLARTRRFEAFRNLQLILYLALPLLLQWTLGGFVPSSAVLLWALISPLAAVVLVKRPLRWFVAYLVLLAVSALLEPALTPARLPGWIAISFFVLNVGGVSAVAFFLLRYFTRGLALERARSEALLLNVLPAPIGRRLKTGERPLADRFEEAAVLFADVVGSTPMAEGLSPEAVVDFLDALFTEFDAAAARRGLEKIKTIGDAYMVVGGVPEPDPQAPERVADLALELMGIAARHTSPSGRPLQLRIGIDVGPVVAGVIGTHKFVYDLWGDTVNTASRMESHSPVGSIQVTNRAYERLRWRYAFEPRGSIEVKGKGEMAVHVLRGRIPGEGVKEEG
jgi:guanylate cyclase